jgi:hypothetical protein
VSGQEKANKNPGRRMQYMSAQQDHIGMLLRQMGADVKQINGLVCFVRFYLDDTELYYVYNLNADDEYFLQRVKPYPMSAGVFPDAAEIADYIEKDLRAFQNAKKSGCFETFISENRRLTALSQGLEDAFLHSNIPKSYCKAVDDGLNALEQTLKDIRRDAGPLPPVK